MSAVGKGAKIAIDVRELRIKGLILLIFLSNNKVIFLIRSERFTFVLGMRVPIQTSTLELYNSSRYNSYDV